MAFLNQTYVVQEGDVVCFESVPSDEHGNFHSAIMGNRIEGYFPPNTLFVLKEVKEPGEWEPDFHTKMKVNQRLLVVRATFQDPSGGPAGGAGGKMSSAARSLSYGGREDYIRGLTDLTAKPLLTMEQEFDRPVKWTDWKGKRYDLREEYSYVRGKAVRLEGCTPGTRDDCNDGKSPEDFLREVNDFIRDRRAEGRGTILPESYAFLTMEELLSARLYSGPAYDPLNKFLRAVAAVSGQFRTAMARDPQLSFAATIGHLCHAIRKVAAVATEEELSQPLFRGVRGELPKAFWVPDARGMVCATDCAFMSTSKNRSTPIDYMGPGANVLWEIMPSAPTDDAYHRGADISMISQFAAEAEVLFPPCTLLVATRAKGRGGDDSAGQRRSIVDLAALGDVDASTSENGEKTIVAVKVVPHFV
jgi:hypothetical protein